MNTDNTGKALVPTKEETMEILSHVMQAQIENPDPMNLPMAFFPGLG